MTKGLCSIIIPSYNHQEYVVPAIQSALEQTYDNIEVIVVDDGSTDRSLEKITLVKDERVVIHVQENMGAHAAINTGMALAKGEYLAILNSDDLFERERIEKCLAGLFPRTAGRFLSTWIRVIDGNGKPMGIKRGWHNLEPWPIEHPERSFGSTDDAILNLLAGNYISTTSNFVMHRSLYERVGCFRNLRFVHDWDYALRALLAGPPVILEEALLSYRLHDRNTISSDRRRMLFEICWVLAAHLGEWEGRLIFGKGGRPVVLKDLEMLYESINLQGNDKLFWVMRSCIESLRKTGTANPEELLIDDPTIRGLLTDMVRDPETRRTSALRRITELARRILHRAG